MSQTETVGSTAGTSSQPDSLEAVLEPFKEQGGVTKHCPRTERACQSGAFRLSYRLESPQ